MADETQSPGKPHAPRQDRKPSIVAAHGEASGRRPSRKSFCDSDGVRKAFRRSSQDKPRSKKEFTLVRKTLVSPGRLHLREIDPRRIVFQESASTRVVLDWRRNRWEGKNREVDTIIADHLRYTMKLTGAPRTNIVPEDNGDPSSEEELMNSESSEEDDQDFVNSDSEDLSPSSKRSLSSAQNSTATGSNLASSLSGVSREMARAGKRQSQIKQKITGWLSQYSGCTKGHGERLMRKIYKPKADQLHVKMNSGVQDVLITSKPCFCSLQSLNFSNLLIGTRGVQALWPLLRYARALKSLNLAGNDIHDAGMQFILGVLVEEVQNQKKDDIGCLVLVDLSQNPITSASFGDICKFNDARKDVLLLGLADTMMTLRQRQRILRQSLSKFAGVEPHMMLEAWRLGNDAYNFFDRELFLQCERIVESTHGTAIHDMSLRTAREGSRRQFGFQDDDEEDDDDWYGGMAEVPNNQDGFLGLESPHNSYRNKDGFEGLDGIEVDDISVMAQPASEARDTPVSMFSIAQTPTPHCEFVMDDDDQSATPRNHLPSIQFSQNGEQPGSLVKQSSPRSWAARRRAASIGGKSTVLNAWKFDPKLAPRALRDQRGTVFEGR